MFSSFFKKKQNALHVPDSILVKRLKSLSLHSNLLVYSNIEIYHHQNIFTIPLIMLDPLRGLYIFEIKTWSYDDLKNAHIQKAKNQDPSAQTLSYDNTHKIIRKKFNELTHNDGVPIFNYLIMENLSADEYQHLNSSFKELLPFSKLIFDDYQDSDIFQKLQDAADENHSLPSIGTILGTLFIQYAIVEDESINIATKEQIEFLDTKLVSTHALNGLASSGKSTLLLLKSLIELLKNPSVKIIILKPTVLACDIFKKKLLEIVEHAIVEADLTSIEIITPLELLNRHLKKLAKAEDATLTQTPNELINKSFKVADIIMCDDANLLPESFLRYLKAIQKRKKLLLVNEKDSSSKHFLTKEFAKEKHSVYFLQTNPYAKALHLIQNLSQNGAQESLVVISNASTQEKLLEDLDSFVSQTPQILQNSQHLIDYKFSPLILATYADINALSVKHIIMLDITSCNPQEAEYALNLATLSTHILYEEECEEILNLKDIYESNQERRRVESQTLS